MDRKVVEQYRLALFGRMVMGVAHEIDNHLSVVLGFSELIQLGAGKEQKVRDGAGKILSAGEKIGAIVHQFSRYARSHAPSPEPFVPGEMIPEILLFSRYDLGRDNVTVLPVPEVPRGILHADRRDFGLAILALLFNAAEAMSETGGDTFPEGVHRCRRVGIRRERPGARDSRGVRGEGLRVRVHHPHRDGPYGNGTPGRAAPRRAGGGNVAAVERLRGRVRRHDPNTDESAGLIAFRRNPRVRSCGHIDMGARQDRAQPEIRRLRPPPRLAKGAANISGEGIARKVGGC